MRSTTEETPTTPLEMRAETVDENMLLALLRVLIAAGKVTEDDVKNAWSLVSDL
jgi:hypothetical protein